MDLALQSPKDHFVCNLDTEKTHFDKGRSPQASSNDSPTIASSPSGSQQIYFRSVFQECMFVLTTTFAVSQSQVFGGALICMANYIGHDLGMTQAEVTWINTAQSLTSGAFLLLFGRLADLFGRRMLMLVSMGLSTACLIATGFVGNGILMDAFLGLLGLVSAASVPPAMGKLGAVYKEPSRRRNSAFAFCSAGTPVGSGVGVLIGGLTLQVSTWRTGFWVLAIINGVATLIAWWAVPDDSEQKLDCWNMRTLKQFDVLGAILAATSIAALTIALTLAGQASHGWRTPYILTLLATGIAVVAIFIYWQTIFAYPLMPLKVWKDKNFTLLVIILCLCFCGFTGNVLWLCLLWQRILHITPLGLVARLLPAVIGGVFANLVAALTMHLISNKVLMAVATVGCVLSNTLLSATSEHISYWALTFPALSLMTVAADFQFTVTITYAMSVMAREHQSVAGAILITMSRLLSTIGLGVQTRIFMGLGGASSGLGALNYRAYQATFWFSLGASVLALIFLPFVTIGSQGTRVQEAPHDATRTAPLVGDQTC